ELKVPYYLLFVPREQELTLYHHTETRHVSVKPSAQARYAIPELEMELGLLDGWVRVWFRGQLLALPAELQRDLEKERKRAESAEAEVARLRQQLAELTKQQKRK